MTSTARDLQNKDDQGRDDVAMRQQDRATANRYIVAGRFRLIGETMLVKLKWDFCEESSVNLEGKGAFLNET